jgi:hypothetical protein
MGAFQSGLATSPGATDQRRSALQKPHAALAFCKQAFEVENASGLKCEGVVEICPLQPIPCFSQPKRDALRLSTDQR